MSEFKKYIIDISTHYYEGITNIFMLNFTLLAFIITAITILLMLEKGMIKQFKEASLMGDVLDLFSKSLHWNFISGSLALIAWIMNIEEKQYLIIGIFTISIIALILALKNTYNSYKFLIFFVKKQ